MTESKEQKSIKEQVLEEIEALEDTGYLSQGINKAISKAIDLTEQLTRKECEKEFDKRIGAINSDDSYEELNVEKEIKELHNKIRADERKKLIEEISKEIFWRKNPYPEDIFIEPTLEQQKIINQLIINAGFTPDKLYGSWGRRVWNNAMEDIKKDWEEFKKKELE